MQGQILVTNEELSTTANDFNQKGQDIRNYMNQMMSRVDSLSGSWEGEAAEAYKRKFKSLEDDIQRMLSMINEHVNDLNEMAGVYKSVEDQNLEAINTLAEDVIS